MNVSQERYKLPIVALWQASVNSPLVALYALIEF